MLIGAAVYGVRQDLHPTIGISWESVVYTGYVDVPVGR